MIKKMRYQFILVTMGCISFIFILILSVINISMTISSRNQGYALLSHMADNPREKDFDKNSSEKKEKNMRPIEPVGSFDAFRSFSIIYDAENNIREIFYNENSDMTEETILEIASKVIDNPHERGVSSKYLYIMKETDDGRQFYFLDYSLEKNLSLRLFWTCLYIGLIGIIFIFILVIFLSRWIVKPVQTTFDKQKQFIADASHELKTPLTIITTNAEVLAGRIGSDKWLNHILAQTSRMNTLIKNLLELAKLDSYNVSLEFADFDMGKAVKNVALSFESMAYEYGKNYEMDISEGILFHGNENSIRQLTTILLDNAFKYSDEKGKISIQLKLHGDKKILSIENTGKGIPKEDQPRIFERFYRSDASRSRESGGYGLGLSIAASIAEAHKGHIAVKSDECTYTKLIVTFS